MSIRKGPRSLGPNKKFIDSCHNGYHWKELVLLITKSWHMYIVCQARAQKPEFCGCHCDSTDSTGNENNTAKVASCCETHSVNARLERHSVQADCAGCVCLCGGKKEGLSAHLKNFSKNLLIHFQYLIPPTIFTYHFTYHFTFIFHFTPSCFFV